MSDSNSSTNTGFGIGVVLAVLLSWTVNHSIIWCIIHGLIGWLYVIYYLLFVYF